MDLPILEKKEEKNYRSTEDILKGKKVLLIEDHPMNIEIAKELLEKKEMIKSINKIYDDTIQKILDLE